MQPLIKITSEPIQIVRFSQGARLVSSGSVDIERRKALARHMSFRRSNSGGQGAVPLDDLRKINRAFSSRNVALQIPNAPQQQTVSRQAAYNPAPVPAPSGGDMAVVNNPSAASVDNPPIAAASGSSYYASTPDISIETSSSYTAQRGAFEMRVAKGELTYLPPLVMTIITQRPHVSVEYLGGFNYVPPRVSTGGNINLFT